MIGNLSLGVVNLHILTIVGIFAARLKPGAAKVELPLALGSHTIGEKLSDFKTKFPNALCLPFRGGKTADGSGKLVCCLNDPAELSALSPFKILFSSKCGATAHFYQERLTKIRFVVDVSSIDLLLPTLTKVYGPPSQDFRDTQNAQDPISIDRMTGWARGDHILSLTQTSVRGEVLNRDPSLSKRQPEAKFVVVCLFDQTKE